MMNTNKKRILWITRTGILVALLIVLQAATAPLGMQLITGSLVNMMLIISVMTCGLSSGLAVAAISPFAAKFLGMGPLWSLIPFIALGNCTLILIWHFITKRASQKLYAGYAAALAAGAVGKFLILYLSIVQLMVPLFLNLPEKQAVVISAMFSFTQLFTALIGGAVAAIALPLIKKALSGDRT